MAFPAAPSLSVADQAAVAGWLVLFRATFTEFADATDALVSAKIAEALTRTPEDVWGADLEHGVLYLAAHLLALSPGGEKMRIDSVTTLYGNTRAKLARSVASGFRVAGID